MIVIDTHIWVWWLNNDSQLPAKHKELLRVEESNGVGVSVLSCWEVAKLVERGRLALKGGVSVWMKRAVARPNTNLLALTPEIAIESTQLPGTFHKDPADQIIVATARIYDAPLMTLDANILAYSYVKLLP